ncbi:hypothetical protein MAR_035014 [Mya arenaria]|uniref:Uncharacterized protein n=1 Tax=Mya arenaria TaxID=6604 RepID=A0ABY7EMT3_MYAAR|nr:hypothetical protein MAR_035014 [Mya arenaria]
MSALHIVVLYISCIFSSNSYQRHLPNFDYAISFTCVILLLYKCVHILDIRNTRPINILNLKSLFIDLGYFTDELRKVTQNYSLFQKVFYIGTFESKVQILTCLIRSVLLLENQFENEEFLDIMEMIYLLKLIYYQLIIKKLTLKKKSDV